MDDALSVAKTQMAAVLKQIDHAQAALERQPESPALANHLIMEAMAGEVGGALSEGILRRRRPGAMLLRHWAKQSAAEKKRYYEAEWRHRARQLNDDAAQIIRRAEDKLAPRTFASLMGAIAKANSAKRPETILRQTSVVAKRFVAHHPRMTKPQASPEEALRKLEQHMRSFIARELACVSRHWWRDRIPGDVKAHAERRHSERRAKWLSTPGARSNPLHFVDFSDYAKIITRKDNWRDAFQPFFRDPEIVGAKLRELEPIRNDIAHSRPISHTNQQKLQLYAGELIQCMMR